MRRATRPRRSWASTCSRGGPGSRTCPFPDPTTVPPVFLAPHRAADGPCPVGYGARNIGARRIAPFGRRPTPGAGPDGSAHRRAPFGVQRVDGCGGVVRNAVGSLVRPERAGRSGCRFRYIRGGPYRRRRRYGALPPVPPCTRSGLHVDHRPGEAGSRLPLVRSYVDQNDRFARHCAISGPCAPGRCRQ